jgi:hypothetical protein
MDVEVRGADALVALGKRLKTQGPALRRDLTKEIRQVAKPATDAATQALADKAPGGRLEEVIRRQRSTVRVSTGAKTAGVRVGAGKKGSGMRMLDRRGQVRHPVFGQHGRSWVTQDVPGAKGVWEQQLRARKRQLERGVVKAMENTARRVVG